MCRLVIEGTCVPSEPRCTTIAKPSSVFGRRFYHGLLGTGDLKCANTPEEGVIGNIRYLTVALLPHTKASDPVFYNIEDKYMRT